MRKETIVDAENKIDIKYGRLFPWPFLLLAVILLVVGLSLIVEKTMVSGMLIVVGGFILSGYEGTDIDTVGKTYREYKSFFFLKTGERIRYARIEKIFISTSKTKQQLYTAHTTKSSIFENIEFNGFIKFDDGAKVQLLRNRKKADLLKALEKISAFLRVSVEDNTV